MASRPRNFSSDSYYHIYNRCVPEISRIFSSDHDYKRFLNALNFYLYRNSLSFAQYQDLPKHRLDLRGLGDRRVRLLAYVIMPNHFHLLLKPKNPAEVSCFLSDITNSYARYFNTKRKRTGPLFQGKFKAKEITDEGSLLQVSRYIHINPILSLKTNRDKQLRKPQDYPYSSYHEWAGFKNPHLVDVEEIKFWAKSVGGPRGYREFVEAKLKMDQDPALGVEEFTLETEP